MTDVALAMIVNLSGGAMIIGLTWVLFGDHGWLEPSNIGDVDDYRSKLQCFVTAKVEAEMEARSLREENRLLRSLIADGPDADEIINRRLGEAYRRSERLGEGVLT